MTDRYILDNRKPAPCPVASGKDRWSRTRPNAGGRWLWREDYDREEVELVLSAGGAEVNEADEAEPEGSPQFYWERTETTQKMMPGLWKRITHRRAIEAAKGAA